MDMTVPQVSQIQSLVNQGLMRMTTNHMDHTYDFVFTPPVRSLESIDLNFEITTKGFKFAPYTVKNHLPEELFVI